MMKRTLTSLAFLSLATVQAQTIDEVSVGAMYMNQTFYELNTGNVTSSIHSDWHIAFSVGTAQSAGILLNEGSSLSGNRAKLYAAPTNDFNDVVDANALTTEYTNAEVSWSEGAFNEDKDVNNPFDYGWGVYDMSSHQVVGNKVYVIEYPNGDYQKIKIDSLVGGVYYFTYADLDGANTQQGMVDKANYTGQTLAYYSLTSNIVVGNIEPTSWDLLFTRYETPIDDGSGTMVPYSVTGVLSGEGVEVVQADGVNTTTVDYNDYINDFSAEDLMIIGSDWKSYDFGAGWILEADRAYFVKTEDGTIWKVVFLDFQGSSTGITTLQKENVGTLSSIENIEQIETFSAYPNPASSQITLAFEANNYDTNATIELYSMDGRMVLNQNVGVNTGFNVVELNGLEQFARGSYVLVLNVGNDKITQSVILK